MSSAAIAWAADARNYGPMPAGAMLVLIQLADHADPSGRHAFPSIERIAVRSGMTARNVQRHIATLRELGLIVLGDQRLVQHIRGDKRPIVYDLDLSYKPPRGDASDTPPRGDASDTPPSSRGDAHVANGVTPTSPKPNTELTTPTPVGNSATQRARDGLAQCIVCGQHFRQTHHCRGRAPGQPPPPGRGVPGECPRHAGQRAWDCHYCAAEVKPPPANLRELVEQAKRPPPPQPTEPQLPLTERQQG